MSYTVLSIPLDVAQVDKEYNIPGGATHLSVLHDPGHDANVSIRVGSKLSPSIRVGGSTTYIDHEEFDTIFVTAAAVAGMTIELGAGVDSQVQGACVEICDNPDRELGIVTIGSVASSDTLTASEGTAPAAAAAIGAALAIDEILIQCKPASPASVFVGSATLQPLEVAPGAAITIQVDNRSKVYVRSPGANGTWAALARG